MPIYEYACSACGHQFEEWQKMSDPPVRTCPKCKRKKVERLISQTAFQLKGGGWYADLYSSSKPGGKEGGAKEGGGGEAKAEKGGGEDKGKKKDSAGGGGGGKDSKPAGDTKAGSAKKAEPRAA